MTIHHVPTVVGTAESVRIEVRVVGRWTARALLESLAPYRSYLIQHDAEWWVVHAQTPGCHGESLESAILAIEDCLEERGHSEATIRIDGKPYRMVEAAGTRS